MKQFFNFLICLLLAVKVHAQDDNTYKQLSQMAHTYYRQKDYKRSAETYESAIAIKGKECGHSEVYNAACAWSLAGYPDKAFKHLNYLARTMMADPEGYMGKSNRDPLTYMFDKDLEPLHSNKQWSAFIGRLQKARKPIENTLDSIYIDDQLMRRQLPEIEKKYGTNSKELVQFWKDINKQDSINLVKVKQILDTSGWLGPDSIGVRGNSTLFLVIQHADLETQEQYLPMIREAVKDKRAKGADLALLEDRVALAKGNKQIYGSQVARAGNGDWYLSPLENPDSVDARRRSVGLGKLYYYLKNWNIVWDVEAYKKQLPEIEEREKRIRVE